MKRSHSSSPLSSGVRKSVRLADDSLTNPPSTSWPLPELIITSENLNIEEAQSACDAYNRVRSYARRNPADAASWRHAAALAKTVREIEDIMRTAHERVEEKLLKLESLTTDFRTAALNVPESYEDVDLLSLTSIELQSALSAIQVSKPDRFAAHVRRLLPEAFSQQPPADEEAYPVYEHQGSFASKFFVLLQKLISHNLYVETFHALVLFKSLLNVRNPRVEGIIHANVHGEIDFLIENFVNTAQVPACIGGCPSSKNDLTGSTQDRYSGLTWRGRGENTRPFFWDFAASGRVLRSAYRTFRCRSSPDECFHEYSIALLDWLQKKAWSEIRANVLLTVGDLLPAELAEWIFEAALEAEEVPNDPTTRIAYVKTSADREGPLELSVPTDGSTCLMMRCGHLAAGT